MTDRDQADRENAPATAPAGAPSDRTLIREAVGVFPDEDSLIKAADALQENGFNHSELSLMASEQAVEHKLGSRYSRVQDAADDPETPRMAFTGPEDAGNAQGVLVGGLMYLGAGAAALSVVASGGALMAAVGAALAGGLVSGGVGSVAASTLGDRRAKEIEQHLQRGGLLLWVRTRTAEQEATAKDILTRHGGEDVHVHEIPSPE